MNPESFFSSIPMEVLLESAGIMLVAIVFWFRWNPRIVETTRDLAALRPFFDQAEPTGKFAIQEAYRKTSNPNVKAILADVPPVLFAKQFYVSHPNRNI